MLCEIAAGAAALIVLLVLIYRLEKQGRTAEQNQQMKQVLNDIHTAALARDRLEHDPDDRKRVRERFTRQLL